MEKAAEYSRSRRGGSGVEQGVGACAALGSRADQAPLCKKPTPCRGTYGRPDKRKIEALLKDNRSC